MATSSERSLVESGPPSRPTFSPKHEWPIFIYDPDRTWAGRLAAAVRSLGYQSVSVAATLDRLPLELGVEQAMILLINLREFTAPPSAALRDLRLYRHDLAVAVVTDERAVAVVTDERSNGSLGAGEDLVLDQASLLNGGRLNEALDQLKEAGERRAWRSYHAEDHNYRTRQEQRSPHTRY